MRRLLARVQGAMQFGWVTRRSVATEELELFPVGAEPPVPPVYVWIT